MMEEKQSSEDESPHYYCTECYQEVSINDTICRHCGADVSQLEEEDASEETKQELNPIVCPRCETALEYVGTKKFYEGTRAFDVLGGIWELLKNREQYDVYVCPQCGRLEFFVDGIGEQFRPH